MIRVGFVHARAEMDFYTGQVFSSTHFNTISKDLSCDGMLEWAATTEFPSVPSCFPTIQIYQCRESLHLYFDIVCTSVSVHQLPGMSIVTSCLPGSQHLGTKFLRKFFQYGGKRDTAGACPPVALIRSPPSLTYAILTSPNYCYDQSFTTLDIPEMPTGHLTQILMFADELATLPSPPNCSVEHNALSLQRTELDICEIGRGVLDSNW